MKLTNPISTAAGGVTSGEFWNQASHTSKKWNKFYAKFDELEKKKVTKIRGEKFGWSFILFWWSAQGLASADGFVDLALNFTFSNYSRGFELPK